MITLILGGLAIAAFITFLPAIILIGLPILMIYLIAGGGNDGKKKHSSSGYSQMSPRERNKFKFAHGLISYDEYMREEARLDFYGYD